MVEDLPSIIARQIIKARQYKKWNQVDLAIATGLSQGTISRYESGTRGGIIPANLIKIANATGVTVDFLLGRYNSLNISDRIRRARSLKQMNQQDLANALHVLVDVVMGYESNTSQYIPIDVVAEIARITGVSVGFLLGKDN